MCYCVTWRLVSMTTNEEYLDLTACEFFTTHFICAVGGDICSFQSQPNQNLQTIRGVILMQNNGYKSVFGLKYHIKISLQGGLGCGVPCTCYLVGHTRRLDGLGHFIN